MRNTIIFLDQQSWPGGAQRVLEHTIESIEGEYDCIAAFPDRGPFRSGLAAKNLETVDLPIGVYQPGKKSLFETFRFAWRSVYSGLRLAAFIRKRHVALVYVNGPRCLPAGVLAAWLTGRPVIFHLHLILTRRLDILLVRSLARRVARVLACSNAAAASLVGRRRSLSAKTDVLYNPLPQSYETRVTRSMERMSRSNPHQLTIGMVGRITPSKGHHLLLKAVAGLSPELRKKVQILIVGSEAPGCDLDHRYGHDLRNEASELGLDGQIVWTGYRPDPESCYALMDVLAHPALEEAMCLAILEALDRGIPVIASRTGGTPEVVRDGFNGLLISLEDETALGHALTLFIEKRGLRECLQAGARQSLDRRFSMETFSSRIRASIGQLCPLADLPDNRVAEVRTERL